jgi:hypothetical protein
MNKKMNVMSSERRSQTFLDYAGSRKTTRFIERYSATIVLLIACYVAKYNS